MRFVLILLFNCGLCWSLQAKTYVIGIEQLDYYPHYDFKSAQPRGYFFDLIQLYSQWSGDEFVFKALPVKRLYKDSIELTDFVYPDNRAWQPHLDIDSNITKYYSAPVIYTLGATMVLPEKRRMTMDEFEVLANIHGFSPTLWMELKNITSLRSWMYQMPDLLYVWRCGAEWMLRTSNTMSLCIIFSK